MKAFCTVAIVSLCVVGSGAVANEPNWIVDTKKDPITDVVQVIAVSPVTADGMLAIGCIYSKLFLQMKFTTDVDLSPAGTRDLVLTYRLNSDAPKSVKALWIERRQVGVGSISRSDRYIVRDIGREIARAEPGKAVFRVLTRTGNRDITVDLTGAAASLARVELACPNPG